MARIADKFNVSLASVKRWNKTAGRKKYLQPGDSLTLYVDITRQY
nr:LysM peptidoglycan-binding domain-containing protein [Aliikangiella sp. G2MR2-5]